MWWSFAAIGRGTSENAWRNKKKRKNITGKIEDLPYCHTGRSNKPKRELLQWKNLANNVIFISFLKNATVSCTELISDFSTFRHSTCLDYVPIQSLAYAARKRMLPLTREPCYTGFHALTTAVQSTRPAAQQDACLFETQPHSVVPSTGEISFAQVVRNWFLHLKTCCQPVVYTEVDLTVVVICDIVSDFRKMRCIGS